MIRLFRVPPPPITSPALAYFMAVALPLAAASLEAAFRSWSENVPFVLLLLVVSLSAWIGGWWPGMVAGAVSSAAGYLFLHTSAMPEHGAAAFVSTCIFTPVAVVAATLASLARIGFLEREAAAGELRERAEALHLSELRLREAIRARDDFISVASHEFRTPLTSAQMRLESLVRRCAIPPLSADAQLVRTISVLDRQMRRLGTLVSNVLDVSRIGAGQLRLDLEEVDLAELVEEVVAQWTEQLDPPLPILSVSPSARIRGRWDRDRLAQVIVNLVSNAMKYGDGKPVTLKVELSGDRARLAVEDHGIGIAAEDHERVFERFERVTKTGSGLGVGLWVARELVSAHGGTIELKSSPGEGSCFTVVLPLDGLAPSARPTG